MSKRSTEVTAFLLGAAAGLVIGYFLNSEKMQELINELKEKAGEWKNEIEDQLEKGKEIVDDLSTKVTEVIEKI